MPDEASHFARLDGGTATVWLNLSPLDYRDVAQHVLTIQQAYRLMHCRSGYRQACMAS